MSSSPRTTETGAPSAPDRGLDAVEGWTVMGDLDAAKVRQARAAFDLLESRRLLDVARTGILGARGDAFLATRPVDWAGALASLELYAGALAAWEGAHAMADALDLLLPHAAFAFLPALVADRSRWGGLT